MDEPGQQTTRIPRDDTVTTVAGAARALGIERRTVEAMALRGKLSAVLVAGRVMIVVESINALKAERAGR